jgi:3-oxoacyl-[acyl-carrier protein] reductase
MELGIKSRRAFVGGSSKGLGFAVARALAVEGARVILCGRDADALRIAGDKIQLDTGHAPEIKCCDLSNLDSIARLSDELNQTGGIDILINNVGGPSPSPAENTTVESFRKGFDQIFLGTTTLTQALLPHMKKQSFGRVITITSTSVVEPIDFLAVSSSMRAAITGFMKTLATEVASGGVTVNMVMPGIIHTDRIESLRKAKAAREGSTLEIEMEKTRSGIPMKRMGRPEELANLVCFLASECASYITGANIAVDGGLRRSW